MSGTKCTEVYIITVEWEKVYRGVHNNSWVGKRVQNQLYIIAEWEKVYRSIHNNSWVGESVGTEVYIITVSGRKCTELYIITIEWERVP